MRNKRTKIDFSKHEFKTYEDKYVTIFELKLPNTRMNSIQYINCCGTMSVTGDFGNWIFCREFHPSSDGYVSAGYWDEKLQISSVQESHEFDSDETNEQIEEFRTNYIDENEIVSDEIMEWLEDLEDNVWDKVDYINVAYRQKPDDVEYESVPFGKVRHIWLNYIYDGFDEMCERIELQENDTKGTI